jgi:putative phosphoesterase
VTTRIAVLADTHVRRGSTRNLPPAAWQQLRAADVILHCGDVVDDSLLSELRHCAPLHTVLGNNDHSLVGVLPERRVVEVDGVRIGMVHDPGRREGRANRMRMKFHDCDIVLFGHTHEPFDGAGLDGQWLMNPGSPTERRRQPVHTMGRLVVHDGALVEHEIVPVS